MEVVSLNCLVIVFSFRCWFFRFSGCRGWRFFSSLNLFLREDAYRRFRFVSIREAVFAVGRAFSRVFFFLVGRAFG